MKTLIKITVAFVAIIAMSIIACEKTEFGTPSTDTTAKKRPTTSSPTISWNEIVLTGIDMHITADTTHCGVLILNWDAQPSCQRYTIYDVNAPVTCWPANTTTNVWYNQYGWGCGFNTLSTVGVRIQGEYADSTTSTLYKYISVTQSIQTGRGQWACN